jgi:hypothetical protein
MLTFAGGHLVITDNDDGGEVVFTTAQKMFTITDYVSGSQEIPDVFRSADSSSAPYTNRNVDFTLASISPLATTVFGMFRAIVTSGGGSTPTFGGASVWGQACGSAVINMNGNEHQTTVGPSSTDIEFMSALGFITFRCSGGNLIMNDRLVMRAWAPNSGSYTILRPEQRIDYRLWCGFL